MFISSFKSKVSVSKNVDTQKYRPSIPIPVVSAGIEYRPSLKNVYILEKFSWGDAWRERIDVRVREIREYTPDWSIHISRMRILARLRLRSLHLKVTII